MEAPTSLGRSIPFRFNVLPGDTQLAAVEKGLGGLGKPLALPRRCGRAGKEGVEVAEMFVCRPSLVRNVVSEVIQSFVCKGNASQSASL